MKLTFPHTKLKALLEQAEQRWPEELRSSWSDPDTGPEPGFWLVGDQGVYLMHNGKFTDDRIIVYATECDPDTMDFDAWWTNKRATFGGDDGAEFIEAKTVREIVELGHTLEARLTPQQMRILSRPARKGE